MELQNTDKKIKATLFEDWLGWLLFLIDGVYRISKLAQSKASFDVRGKQKNFPLRWYPLLLIVTNDLMAHLEKELYPPSPFLALIHPWDLGQNVVGAFGKDVHYSYRRCIKYVVAQQLQVIFPVYAKNHFKIGH